MSGDDWSLKGKAKVPYYDREMLDADEINSDRNERYFPLKEIEILRQKLIDKMSWIADWEHGICFCPDERTRNESKRKQEQLKGALIKEINELFGMKE